MLGISRGVDYKLTKKEKSFLLKKQVKTVKGVSGEVVQLFCSCGLPLSVDAYFVSEEKQLVCASCFYPCNLDLIISRDIGYLIYCPELSQEVVNAFAIAISYVVGLNLKVGGNEDLIDEVLSVFLARRDKVERVICEGASLPSIMCQFLYSLSDDDYLDRGRILKDIRLFPSAELLAGQLDFLIGNELKKFHPNKWVGLLQHVNKELNK